VRCSYLLLSSLLPCLFILCHYSLVDARVFLSGRFSLVLCLHLRTYNSCSFLDNAVSPFSERKARGAFSFFLLVASTKRCEEAFFTPTRVTCIPFPRCLTIPTVLSPPTAVIARVLLPLSPNTSPTGGPRRRLRTERYRNRPVFSVRPKIMLQIAAHVRRGVHLIVCTPGYTVIC